MWIKNREGEEIKIHIIYICLIGLSGRKSGKLCRISSFV